MNDRVYNVICFTVSNDPPRPKEGTTLYQEMAGYSAPRGEFTTEYDNYAEMEISHIHGEDFTQMKDEEEDNDADKEEEEEREKRLLSGMSLFFSVCLCLIFSHSLSYFLFPSL